MNLYKIISESLQTALAKVPELAGADLSAISVETPKNPEFGDFATNAAMMLARPMGKPPRAVAEIILPHVSALPFVADASVAGPGFINIKLKDEFISESAANRFPISAPASPLTIDLEYGSYNVAKSLHIGHGRASIFGDTLNRISKYLGHKTISYNYIGDWGRPIGLVIAWIEYLHPDWPFFKEPFDRKSDLSNYIITEDNMNTFYPLASARAKDDPEFLAHAQQITKEFQDGHPGYTALYNIFLQVSLDMMDDIIRRLNMLPFDNTLGERNASQYLAPVEKMLRGRNLLTPSDGAEIVVVKRESDNAPMPPFMFFNSRGADTYDSTDLATIYFRKVKDNPDKIIYLTDQRQTLHFQQLFRVAEMLDLFSPEKLEHMTHGTVNGPDGKPFKTRDGNVAGLLDIIQMVNDAAAARVKESGKNLPPETIEMIALAALKFNDLMHDVKSDYIFDPDAVTQFEGRTGPYILYTAVRLNSVLKKADERASPPSGGGVPAKGGRGGASSDLTVSLHPEERALLLSLLDFERIVNMAFERRATDLLANYTYDLCQSVNTFYHNCPILRDDVPADVRAHRLNMVRQSVMTLSTAIDLMGLKIPDEM
ncbi:MAG: arginine--tRNA ligase [Proteobacteria bacterium]|nr:arginine--tRNA ligase [Pseudomonadota bacterium]